MAGNRMAGLTIAINGETTGLSKALSGVNKQSRDLQSELKEVDRLLKLDPKNTELLSQKQKLLAESVSTTKSKLDTLKEAEKQAQEQFKKGDISEEQYRALQREVIKTEEALKSAEQQAKEFGDSAKQSAENAAKGFKDAGEKIKKTGEAFSPVSKAAAATLGGLVAATQGTKELRSDLSKLEMNAKQAGASLDITKGALKDLEFVTGETDSNIEALSNLMAAGFTNNQMLQAVEALSGAVIQFPDTLKIESLSDSLQETLATGNAAGQFGEMLGRLGLNLDDFNAGLQKAKKSGNEQNYALQVLASTGLSDVNEAYVKANQSAKDYSDAQWDLQKSTADIGKTMEPILAQLTQMLADTLGKFAGWFNGLGKGGQKNVLAILAITAALAPLLIGIGQLSIGIGGLIQSVPLIAGAFGGIATFFTGTLIPAVTGVVTAIGGVIAAIGAVPIAIVTAVVATVAAVAVFGDEIQSALGKADDFMQNVFARDWSETFGGLGDLMNAFFASFKNIWDAIMSVLNGVIDLIRGVFTGDWERAWNGVKDIFGGIFGALEAMAKAPLNGIIALLNSAIGGLNTLIKGLNKIKIDIPSWVPAIGGKEFGISIPEIGKIPYLANGGILSSGSAIVGEAGAELLSMINGKAQVTPLTSGAKQAVLAGAGTTTNNYYVTVDAKNVKEFNDVVRVFNGTRQTRRQF